jgi:selenocysteine lyase/cysteine desulfurase
MDRLMRISPAIFNTPADIDRLAEVLERHLRA